MGSIIRGHISPNSWLYSPAKLLYHPLPIPSYEKPEFSKREVNVGFSGGEKKRNEIFQMAMLDPVLSILDETDSGLDVDALRIVAGGVNALHTREKAVIVITHYQRLLDYIVPDVVHVLKDGKIVKTAGRELVAQIEEAGYDSIV